MRLLVFLLAIITVFSFGFPACKSDSAPSSFCDTTCLKDSIKFVDEKHPYQPYVFISTDDCMADTVTWSYIDMGFNRKMSMTDLAGTKVYVNKDNIACYIRDTSYAWLRLNNCATGRGFLIKVPFNKRENIGRKSSGLNSFDPKFSVAEGLVAYSDRGNIFVEDMATGKSAMMTFGERIEVDYDAIHETIDSVNITPTRIWAKVLINKEWKPFEKSITLK